MFGENRSWVIGCWIWSVDEVDKKMGSNKKIKSIKINVKVMFDDKLNISNCWFGEIAEKYANITNSPPM